nr:hypothetical protein [Tanacetum cinerariifolium]
METTIEQQVALDEALVPSTQRLRIERSKFRLLSDIQSKESTLQVVYDVLRRCPFFKAFLVTADVPKIYMIPGQSFDELPFEEEILEFLRFLGYSAQIRTLTDVNINKLFQPGRSFGAVINKCLTEKSSGFDSFRRKRSGSDTFVTPPTAITTLTITGGITPRLTVAAKGKQPAKAKSPSDPSDLVVPIQMKELVLNQGFWMYPLMIKKKKSHGTLWMMKMLMLKKRTEMTMKAMKKMKVMTEKRMMMMKEMMMMMMRKSSDDEDVDAQEKNRDDDEGNEKGESDDGKKDDDNDDDDEEEIAKTDEQDDAERGGDNDKETKNDEESDGDETREEESFDPIPRTPEDSEDDGNGEEDQGLRITEEERIHEEEEVDELYRDIDINQGRGLPLSQDIEDSHVTLTPVHPDG